jgi:hypothetical protein
MRGIHSIIAGSVVALAVLFPPAASACIIPPRPVMAFWSEKPTAEPGEVVVRLRLLRVENPSPVQVISYCGQPALFVFEVVQVAEGEFAPREVYLYGAGKPLGEDTGWLVGTPRTLYMKHILWLKDGDPPAPEYDSIQWRPPEFCIGGFNCRPPWPEQFAP